MSKNKIVTGVLAGVLIASITGCVEVSKSIHSLGTMLAGESENDKRITALGQEYVLYFFSNGELHSRNMATYVKSFSEIYKWEVCEITPKGAQKSGDFVWTSENAELFKMFHVNEFPMAFAVHKKANIAIKVIEGEQYCELKERIIYYHDKIQPKALQDRSTTKIKPPLVILDGIDNRADDNFVGDIDKKKSEWNYGRIF